MTKVSAVIEYIQGIILDEATANVDPEAEEGTYKNFVSERKEAVSWKIA